MDRAIQGNILIKTILGGLSGGLLGATCGGKGGSTFGPAGALTGAVGGAIAGFFVGVASNILYDFSFSRPSPPPSPRPLDNPDFEENYPLPLNEVKKQLRRTRYSHQPPDTRQNFLPFKRQSIRRYGQEGNVWISDDDFPSSSDDESWGKKVKNETGLEELLKKLLSLIELVMSMLRQNSNPGSRMEIYSKLFDLMEDLIENFEIELSLLENGTLRLRNHYHEDIALIPPNVADFVCFSSLISSNDRQPLQDRSTQNVVYGIRDVICDPNTYVYVGLTRNTVSARASGHRASVRRIIRNETLKGNRRMAQHVEEHLQGRDMDYIDKILEVDVLHRAKGSGTLRQWELFFQWLLGVREKFSTR